MSKSMQLMLLMGGLVPQPVPQQLADALQSVQVNSGVGQRGGFQLSFAVSKRSLITQALLPAGFLDPKTRVIIVTILGGMPTVLMDGVITRQEMSPSDTPGGSTLTITGEDLTLLFDLVHRKVAWPAVPPEARVAAICARYARYGIVPVPIPPVFRDMVDPLERIPVQPCTDLEYINALADVAGYTFFIEPGPLPGANIAYWGPEARFGLLQPALNINMDAATNVESMSFSFDGLTRTQYTITRVEPITKIGVPIPVPDISLLRPPLAARPAITLKQQPLPDSGNLDLVEAMLLGLAKTTQASDAISGQGKLDVLRYGHPLKARHLVGVRGAGLAYDGAYFVKSVTHEIKRGDYKQSFTLARDGLVALTPQVVP
ncbi:MAG: hypothetical protein ACRDOO_18105 [Actinomadura sp.]